MWATDTLLASNQGFLAPNMQPHLITMKCSHLSSLKKMDILQKSNTAHLPFTFTSSHSMKKSTGNEMPSSNHSWKSLTEVKNKKKNTWSQF